MKLQPYIQKLESSSAYKKFKEEYPGAFLVAGFFILDFESNQHIHQIDFYIPSKKKFAAFNLDKKVTLQILDAMSSKSPEQLDVKTNIDLDALAGIIEDEMKNRNITDEIKKIIAVVQTIHGKKMWNVNSVLSGMGILKAHVEDETQTVLEMEKTSFSEIMKKLPAPPQLAAPVQKDNKEETPEDEAEELKKLEQLEVEIEKEKERLKKDVVKKEKTPANNKH